MHVFVCAAAQLRAPSRASRRRLLRPRNGARRYSHAGLSVFDPRPLEAVLQGVEAARHPSEMQAHPDRRQVLQRACRRVLNESVTVIEPAPIAALRAVIHPATVRHFDHPTPVDQVRGVRMSVVRHELEEQPSRRRAPAPRESGCRRWNSIGTVFILSRRSRACQPTSHWQISVDRLKAAIRRASEVRAHETLRRPAQVRPRYGNQATSAIPEQKWKQGIAPVAHARPAHVLPSGAATRWQCLA